MILLKQLVGSRDLAKEVAKSSPENRTYLRAEGENDTRSFDEKDGWFGGKS